MDRFVYVRDLQSERVHEALMASYSAPRPPKGPRSARAWHSFNQDQKALVVERFQQEGGFSVAFALLQRSLSPGRINTKLKLALGANCPPVNTVKGWEMRLVVGAELVPRGRPTLMRAEQEGTLMKFVHGIREQGAALDTEMLQQLGQKVASETGDP